VEVKLGEFKITHASNVPETPVNVKFTVYGLLPEKKKEEFDASIDKHKQRMRDAVISLVHKTDFEALNDPSLDGLKSELIVAINQSLETNAVKDLVFSAFSIERG
jgi:flagellar basal body-associated protein FliL